MKIFNCHTHSFHSHDGSGTIEEMAKNALLNNLTGFAVTDHCDCEYSDNEEMQNNLAKSFQETKRLSQIYKNKLVIAAGVEIGDSLYDRGFAKKIIDSYNWDVVLCSVHAVRIESYDMPFSMIDFSDSDKKFIDRYISKYFDDLLLTATEADYDILCHLTVVFRYIKYKYKKDIEINNYINKIEKILQTVISRDKVLEINISGYDDGYLMPESEIIELYKKLGGNKFSLGNDSHNVKDISKNLLQVQQELKKYSINQLTFFMNRKEIYYDI